MKNWDRLEADVDLIMNKHYTSGRAGSSISEIVLHHNAGNLTIRGCYDLWQTRKASAHYQVQGDGRIGQLVWDRDTAWHAGNSAANNRSIGIEHANNRSNPWTISDAALDNGAHLVAALCVHYKLGSPRWGVNVFPHKHYSATACPGEIAGSQNAAYMERAVYWYEQMTGSGAAKTSPALWGQDNHENTDGKDADMATTAGIYWEDGDETVYALLNTTSGFWCAHSGVGGEYNNPLAAALQTTSWAKVTKNHAEVLKEACERVRTGTAEPAAGKN